MWISRSFHLRNLALEAPTPQNGQTHSNNSNCLSVFNHFMELFNHFVGLALNGLIKVQENLELFLEKFLNPFTYNDEKWPNML